MDPRLLFQILLLMQRVEISYHSQRKLVFLTNIFFEDIVIDICIKKLDQ